MKQLADTVETSQSTKVVWLRPASDEPPLARQLAAGTELKTGQSKTPKGPKRLKMRSADPPKWPETTFDNLHFDRSWAPLAPAHPPVGPGERTDHTRPQTGRKRRPRGSHGSQEAAFRAPVAPGRLPVCTRPGPILGVLGPFEVFEAVLAFGDEVRKAIPDVGGQLSRLPPFAIGWH